MAFLTKRGVVSAVIEANGYGLAPAAEPTVGSHDMLVGEPSIGIEYSPNQRSAYRPTLSLLRDAEGAKSSSFSCTAEHKTSGQPTGDGAAGAGTAWECAPLLRACGFTQASTAETGAGNEDGRITYVPRSYGFESVTVQKLHGGETSTSSIKQIVRGCVGSCTFEFPAGEIPTISFSMQGKYVDIADDATTDWTGASYQTSMPQLVESIVCAVDSYSTATIRNLSVDLGNEIAERRSVNAPYFSGAVNLTFADADPDTIVRASGSWITDGFLPGMKIKVIDSTSNDGEYTIASVAALTLTLISTDALSAEGPSGSIIVKGSNDGVAGFHITGRQPTFSLVAELELASDKDFWQLLDEGDTLAISATVSDGTPGNTPNADNRIYFSLPTATITSMEVSDESGIMVLNVSGALYGTDNEILIVHGNGTTA